MTSDDVSLRYAPALGLILLSGGMWRFYLLKRGRLLLLAALGISLAAASFLFTGAFGLWLYPSNYFPEWMRSAYWWSLQWGVPTGLLVGGGAFLAFSEKERRGA